MQPAPVLFRRKKQDGSGDSRPCPSTKGLAMKPMSRNVMLVVTLALSAKSVSAAPVTLAERTTVRVRLLQTLVSGSQKKGEEIRFEVAEDVLGPHRELLVTRGTPAFGTI